MRISKLLKRNLSSLLTFDFLFSWNMEEAGRGGGIKREQGKWANERLKSSTNHLLTDNFMIIYRFQLFYLPISPLPSLHFMVLFFWFFFSANSLKFFFWIDKSNNFKNEPLFLLYLAGSLFFKQILLTRYLADNQIIFGGQQYCYL